MELVKLSFYDILYDIVLYKEKSKHSRQKLQEI